MPLVFYSLAPNHVGWCLRFMKIVGSHFSIGSRSSLYTGERRAKDDRIFSALGAIDELSCQVILFHNVLKCLKSVLFEQRHRWALLGSLDGLKVWTEE